MIAGTRVPGTWYHPWYRAVYCTCTVYGRLYSPNIPVYRFSGRYAAPSGIILAFSLFVCAPHRGPHEFDFAITTALLPSSSLSLFFTLDYSLIYSTDIHLHINFISVNASFPPSLHNQNVYVQHNEFYILQADLEGVVSAITGSATSMSWSEHY